MKHTENSTVKALDLGTRSVCKQNFSWVVTLPHTFVKNFLTEEKHVSLQMTHSGKLVLTPVSAKTKKKVEK
jgi:antitoxin component of MazEF toxin-antitoxin module